MSSRVASLTLQHLGMRPRYISSRTFCAAQPPPSAWLHSTVRGGNIGTSRTMTQPNQDVPRGMTAWMLQEAERREQVVQSDEHHAATTCGTAHFTSGQALHVSSTSSTRTPRAHRADSCSYAPRHGQHQILLRDRCGHAHALAVTHAAAGNRAVTWQLDSPHIMDSTRAAHAHAQPFAPSAAALLAATPSQARDIGSSVACR
jgi:hypothetical protein